MKWPHTQRIERRFLLWAAVSALAAGSRCTSTPLQMDGGTGAGGSSAGGRGGAAGGAAAGTGGSDGTGVDAGADAGACTPSDGTVFCLPGSGADVDTCGDFLTPATCSGGHWVCSPGTGVPTRCRCPGLNTAMCICTSDGWQCGTGGTGGAGGHGGGAGTGGLGGGGGSAGGGGGTSGGCALPQQYCAVGSGGMCSDVGMPATCQAGAWVCPPGMVNTKSCVCTGAPRPGCSCTSNGWQCGSGGNQGHGGTGGQGGGAGAGGSGGSGGEAGGRGGAGGAGGSSVACSAVTTVDACDARSDCHSVFTDPHNCACAALGCCARFSRCADGNARCTSGVGCEMLTPYCESPYVVSYTPTCYEGCVRATACAK